MKIIYPTGKNGVGKVIFVDDDMYEEMNRFKWLLDGKGYAVRHEPRVKGKKRGWIYMHRIINNTPKTMVTDHVNRIRRDNRKENLRSVTMYQNSTNLGLAKNSTSGVRGLTFCRGKWQAQIMVKQKCIYLGQFICKDLAISARKAAETKYNFL